MKDYFEIDFLHVDAKRSGDAIAIRYRVNDVVCIHVTDGGYQDTGQALADHIKEFYDSPSFIDHVVATHPDGDHAGGLRTIIEEFDVGALWMLRPWEYAGELIENFTRFTNVENLKERLREIYPNIAALEEIADRRGIPIHEPFQGAGIGAFTVLTPTKERYLQLILESEKTPESTLDENQISLLARGGKFIQAAVSTIRAAWGEEKFPEEGTSAENEMSVVQYASICGRKILLTGDAGREGLTEAADFTPIVGLSLPGIDRFQVPHHGSRRNLSTELLDRWLGSSLSDEPSDGEGSFSAVISASKNDEDHPRKVVVRALRHRGAKVVSTGDGNGTKRTSHNAPPRDGWSAAKPLEYPSDMED